MSDANSAPGLDVRFGLNLLVYTAAFSADQVGLIDQVAEMGFDGVEIPFTDLDLLDAPATRKACQRAGMGLTACCVLLPGTNLCSPDADERAAGLARIRRMIDLAAEMGGEAVAGPIYSPVSHLTGRARTQEEWDRCAEGLAAAAEHAGKAGIILAIEPLNRFETYVLNTAADAAAMVDAVGSPHLKVQMDTFHANIEEKNTAEAIRAVGGRLGHFHACENDRGAPGTGQVPWPAVFAALKDIGYGGWITMESFATGILDLCAAACIWRPIYESVPQYATEGLAFLKRMAAEA